MLAKILLIEDQLTDNRRSIAKLREEGYELLLASGPAAAKMQLEEHPDLDLIVLDCIMAPGEYSAADTREGALTGYRLYKNVLEETRIPVVLWTVLGEAFASGQEGLDWGESVILKARKRMEEDELVNLVERAEAILRGQTSER